MELNEKIQMLLDMQEHPENYSEQTLEAMLKDPEVRELIEATAQLKQAMTWENESKNTANLDAEWHRFSKTFLFVLSIRFVKYTNLPSVNRAKQCGTTAIPACSARCIVRSSFSGSSAY